MFGKILHEVGALDQIAAQLLKRFGQSKAHYALGIAGLICALPLFFDVAVVLLIGIVFAVARRTDGNIVKLAIPLFAGVAAAASFLLPGPVPMLLASQMKADFGWMIAIGPVAAVIGMLIAGPLYGSFISRFVNWPMPPEENEPTLTKGNLPSFGFSGAGAVPAGAGRHENHRRAAGHPGFAAAAVAGVYRPPVHRHPAGLSDRDLRPGETARHEQ